METQLVVFGLLGPIGWQELLIVGLVGLLIFGRRLPEVGRSLGKSIVEFKRGLADAKHEVQDATKELPSMDDVRQEPPAEGEPASPPDRADPTASTS
ncbi:MAG: twin-arginine translocase TatA/TatE family subunit [Phycisphaerales bacterium]|nr:MAG: twin-arginine translocase TatA/TatE family subunit [Phycisphaerales bacterium]